MHRHLFRPLIQFAVAIPLFLTASAHALTRHVRITPGSPSSEIVVDATWNDSDDALTFRVRRELAQVKWAGRSADLQFGGAAGATTRVPLEPAVEEGHLVYTFTVARAHADHAVFQHVEFTMQDGQPMVGGRTIYEVRAGDFLNVNADDLPVGTDLAREVIRFNAAAPSAPWGTPEGAETPSPAPLTLDEVRAAIRWWRYHRDDAPVTDDEFAAFLDIAETGTLPPGARLSVITHFEPEPGISFEGWSVRLVVPRHDRPGATYAYILRERWLRSRTVG